MLNHLHLDQLICLDIETVPGVSGFLLLPEALKELYIKNQNALKRRVKRRTSNTSTMQASMPNSAK
jgi:hypothetical protein